MRVVWRGRVARVAGSGEGGLWSYLYSQALAALNM